jgi:hypothetical protein
MLIGTAGREDPRSDYIYELKIRREIQNPQIVQQTISLNAKRSTLDHARKNDLIRSKIFKKLFKFMIADQ